MELSELAALMQGARVAIGVDSMAMHLAAMWKVPQVVLFGPTRQVFRWVGVVPFQRANGHGGYLAELESHCRTCGQAWTLTTPIGMVEKYAGKRVRSSHGLDVVNCPECRQAKRDANALARICGAAA